DLGPQAEASIVLLPAGGGEEQLITSPTTLTEVAGDWSADGAWILGSSDHQTPGRMAICLFPISAAPRAETQMRVLSSHPEYSLWEGHYSPTSAGSRSTPSTLPRLGSALFTFCPPQA